MRYFQILQDGVPLNFNMLNEEVAIFWNKEFISNKGTRPFPKLDTTFSELFEGEIWAEIFMDTLIEYDAFDWKELSINFTTNLMVKYDDIEFALRYNKPYLDLIEYFDNRSYTFKSVDNDEVTPMLN